jgi:hypothetical protein
MRILKVKIYFLGILAAALWLTAPIVMATDIHLLTGIWKHSDKDVWNWAGF